MANVGNKFSLSLLVVAVAAAVTIAVFSWSGSGERKRATGKESGKRTDTKKEKKAYTRRKLPNGDEESVGELQMDDVEFPEEEWPISKSSFVFISHTQRDGVKEDIARATKWFLEEVLKIRAFLDDGDIQAGLSKTQALIAPAYMCTHALVILSPSYRTRRFCVQELNTFMGRWLRSDGIRIIPALWMISNVDGYHAEVDNLTWLKHGGGINAGPVDFLVQTLWPALVKEFHSCQMSRTELEGHLLRYVEASRGGTQSIPLFFEVFYQRQAGHGQTPSLGVTIVRKSLLDAAKFAEVCRRHAASILSDQEGPDYAAYKGMYAEFRRIVLTLSVQMEPLDDLGEDNTLEKATEYIADIAQSLSVKYPDEIHFYRLGEAIGLLLTYRLAWMNGGFEDRVKQNLQIVELHLRKYARQAGVPEGPTDSFFEKVWGTSATISELKRPFLP